MEAIGAFLEVALVIAAVAAMILVVRYYWAKYWLRQRVEAIKREQETVENLSLDSARERADLVLRSGWPLRTRLLAPGLVEQLRPRVSHAVYDVWMRFGAVDLTDHGVSIAPDSIGTLSEEVRQYLEPDEPDPDSIMFGRNSSYVVASPHVEHLIDVAYDYQGGMARHHRSLYHWILYHAVGARLSQAMSVYYRHDLGL
jgi:hypothetical protein